MVAIYAPLVDATMEVKYELSEGHLWLEEVISGDRHTDIETVWGHFDQALWYATAMLEGGENPEGKFIPLDDEKLRNSVIQVIGEVNRFRDRRNKIYRAIRCRDRNRYRSTI